MTTDDQPSSHLHHHAPWKLSLVKPYCSLLFKFNSRWKLITTSSLFISLASLIWFLLRTGTKPSRATYPCQQIARNNIAIFGIPLILPFLHRLQVCHKYRRRIAMRSLIATVCLVLGIGLYSFAKTSIGSRFIAPPPSLGPIQLVQASSTGNRVVWISNPTATSWAGQSGYWNYVNQEVVNTMLDRSLLALTDTSDLSAAWHKLIPGYAAGQTIAVKVNFNSSSGCTDTDNNPESLHQPIIALIRSLKTAGFPETSIYIVDPSRPIPARFSAPIKTVYPSVNIIDSANCVQSTPTNWLGWSSTTVSFNPPSAIPMPGNEQIANAMVNATYIINVPILKKHGIPGITLGFKNHFGSIKSPVLLHQYINISGGSYFSRDYNPLVDIYKNANIRAKTILTIGDGLIGHKEGSTPSPAWNSFNGKTPNSLFLSTDPVAIDSVMADILNREISLDGKAYYYLEYAQSQGLGTYESSCASPGNCTLKYSHIQLLKCDNGTCAAAPPTFPPAPTPSPSPSPTPTLKPSPTPSPTPVPTPALKPGDANGDGKVDGVDYLIWQRHYNQPGTWADGNFDGNNMIDGVDYLIWLTNYAK